MKRAASNCFLIQGLDTALKCCYDDIEETLTVPPEVRRKKHQFQVFTTILHENHYCIREKVQKKTEKKLTNVSLYVCMSAGKVKC